MGYYYYENHSDGLMEFSTKKAAINNAKKSVWLSHEKRIVYSPSGKIVWSYAADEYRRYADQKRAELFKSFASHK